MWCIEKLYIYLVTYSKNFHPKSPFYEKMKMTQKGLQSLLLLAHLILITPNQSILQT